MTIAMPAAVTHYLACNTNPDTSQSDSCFHADAVVHDEGGTFRGIEAIQGWKAAVAAKYPYRLQPLGLSRIGDTLKLR